jgi:hypothetical protein
VIDNVAHTITYTVPVLGAANPTFNCSGFCGASPNVVLGKFDVSPLALGDNNLANGEVGVSASASVSPSLAGQEGKFRLVYQSTVVYNPMGNITATPTLLPVAGFNLRGPSSLWDDAVGGHNIPFPGDYETAVSVAWTGVTGTGTVTITLSFSATA